MGSIQEGARQVVENCLNVQKGEKVLVITDKATEEIGIAIEAAALRVTEGVTSVNLNQWPRPLTELPQEVAKSVGLVDVTIYAATGEPGELQAFRSPLIKLIDNSKPLRHAHMVGVTAEVMRTGMAVDYERVSKVTRLVHYRVSSMSIREFRIATPGGTDLVIRVSPRSLNMKWHISDGIIGPGEWSNLPDGETFTYVPEASGTIVIDSLLGDFFTERYGSLAENPLRFEVADSRVVRGSVACENEELLKDFVLYVLNTDLESDRLGEFAFGTNIFLEKLIGDFLQDEKFPGIHLALGDPIGSKTGADWESKAHVDMLLPDASVWTDGKLIMEGGKYLFLPQELYQ